MEFSEFAFRVVLLFLPGVICGSIVDALTVHHPRKAFGVLLRAFVFGMGAYYMYGGIMLCLHGWWIVPHKMVFFRALGDKNIPLKFGEIAFVCFLACLEGIACSASSNYKWGYNLARWLRLTQESGRLDIWEAALYKKKISYVTVRDQKHDLVYEGWIEEFSDDGEKRELLLGDVRVSRNSDGTLLYGLGAVYLSLKKNDAITLEFPGVAQSESFKKQLEEERSHARANPTTVPETERGSDQEGGNKPAAQYQLAASSSRAPAAFGGVAQKEVANPLLLFGVGLLVALFCRRQR